MLATVAGFVLLSIQFPVETPARLIVEPSVFPQRVVFPGTHRLTFRLAMRAENQDEVFAIRVFPPRYADGSSPLQGPPTIHASDGLQLGNAARLTEENTCAYGDVWHRGYEFGGVTVDALVAAGQRGELTATFGFGSAPTAPFPGTRVTAHIELRSRLVGGYPSTSPFYSRQPTVSGTRRIVVPHPDLILRRSGVRIRLRTFPSTVQNIGRVPKPTRLRRGTVFRVRGTTSPALRSRKLQIRFSGPGTEDELRLVRSVRTDARGHFSLRGWRPRRRGLYEVYAVFRSSRGFYLSDYSCPRIFRLT